MRLGHLLTLRSVCNRPDLPLLSVYREHGVILKTERSDNFNKPGEDLGRYQVVEAGDVVLNRMKAWRGSIGVSPVAGIVSPDYYVARPNTNADSRYLHYLLRSRPMIAEYGARSTGIRSNQWRLQWNDMRLIRVTLPPLSDQSTIGSFLDRQCERIVALESRLDRLLVVSGNEVSARVAQSVGAADAELRPLSWATDPARPIMYGIVLPGEPVSDGILLIKGGDVERNQLLPEHLVRVDRAIESKFTRARLRAGDLLVTIRGSWGASAQVPAESNGANITQDTARVSPAEHVDARFLLHILRTPSIRASMTSVVRGTGVKGINIFDLRRLKVPMPSITEQRVLSARFDAWAFAATRLEDTVRVTKSRLHEYRDALITEAVTGQLDVTAVSGAQMDERLHGAVESATV